VTRTSIYLSRYPGQSAVSLRCSGGHPEVVQTTLARTLARISCLLWRSSSGGRDGPLAPVSRLCPVVVTKNTADTLPSDQVTSSWSGGAHRRQFTLNLMVTGHHGDGRDDDQQEGLRSLSHKTSIVHQGVSGGHVDRSRS